MKINEIIVEGITGLWDNIRKKRERIKHGSGERMRKPGSKGAPTAQNFKDAASESVAEASLEEDKGMKQYWAFKREWRAKHGANAKVPSYDSKEYNAYCWRQGDKQQGVAEDILEETYHGDEFYEAYGELWYDEEQLNEAEYQGRKVPLGKPMRSSNGPKKFHVFVKNEKGNIVKVNFGDPNMRIKKSIPGRRKSFRARHHCENPGPKTSARYWSCRKW